MTDLIKRLRLQSEHIPVRTLFDDAADRIEELVKERDEYKAAAKVAAIQQRRERHIEEVEGTRSAPAFFSRLRSDFFASSAVSGTLAKRYYKSYTDLVVHQNGVVRRVMPQERMALQGFPRDWLEGVDLPLTDQFRLNGMSVPVVQHIGELINDKLL